MAHYALLDLGGTVTAVFPGPDSGVMDWEQFYTLKFGVPCKRTSYNTAGGVHLAGGTPFRKNYAGIGYTYDPVRDAFIPPKPPGEFVLDEASCLWVEAVT